MSAHPFRRVWFLLTIVSALSAAPLLLLQCPPANAEPQQTKKPAKQSPRPHATSQSGQDYNQYFEQTEKLGKEAQAALDAGNTKAATRYAKARLAMNTNKDDWNYGNIIYEANQILGLAALHDSNIAKAKEYLLLAGKTPGSPQLDSFGPNMVLAQELLKKGQSHVVSEFLTLIAKFWATSKDGSKLGIDVATTNAHKIAKWQKEIKSGKRPNLDRFDFDGEFEANIEPIKQKKLLTAGTTAPDFNAIDKDNKPVKLSDYRGKIIVVDFWASWCLPCVASMPHNQEVIKKLQTEGLPVVLLAIDNSEERPPFLKWVNDHKEMDALLFAHADSTTINIADKLYNVTGIPTQYVIDAQGVIRKSFVGFGGPNDDLEKAVRAAYAVSPDSK